MSLTLAVPLPGAAADYLRMQRVPIVDVEGFRWQLAGAAAGVTA